MKDERLLTTADLALRWQTTEQAVYAARHRGDCPGATKVGKRLLWRLRDVEAWEDFRAGHDGRRASARIGRPDDQLVAARDRSA